MPVKGKPSREKDKGFRYSAKLQFAVGSGFLVVAIWGLNPHDHDINITLLGMLKDIILVCLGVHGTMAITDAAENILVSKTKKETDNVTQEEIIRHVDPKDIDGPAK